jgi:hypothetical protein
MDKYSQIQTLNEGLFHIKVGLGDNLFLFGTRLVTGPAICINPNYVPKCLSVCQIRSIYSERQVCYTFQRQNYLPINSPVTSHRNYIQCELDWTSAAGM